MVHIQPQELLRINTTPFSVLFQEQERSGGRAKSLFLLGFRYWSVLALFGWKICCWGFVFFSSVVSSLLCNSTTVCIASENSVESVDFTSGVTLYSPLNKTYSTNVLNLNLTAGVGIGITCTINYNLDNQHYGTIPLQAVHHDELHVINEVEGNTTLPELTQGRHNLTLQVICELNHKSSATMNRFPFIPECNNITDYTATWTDTIQFIINREQQIPEFTTKNIFLITILTTTIILIHKIRKGKNSKTLFTIQLS